MADDLQDLGSTSIWRQTINWLQIPGYDYDGAGRQIVGYDGTAQQLRSLSDEKPQLANFLFQADTKSIEKDFLDQFASLKGRHGRFWQLWPTNIWTLTGITSAGSTLLEVNRVEFEYRGFERFYILLANGDLITRAISAYTIDEINNTADIEFATPTDRILDPAAILLFSPLLLARLDNDAAELRYQTNGVSQVRLSILELVKEYSLA